MSALDRTAPLSDERRASIVAAYYRSQYEPMQMGVAGLIAWNGVLDLDAEIERLRRENTRLSAELAAAITAEQKGSRKSVRYTATGFGATTTEATGQVVFNIDTADGRVDIDLGTEFAEPMGLLLLDDPEHSDGGTFDDEEVADHV